MTPSNGSVDIFAQSKLKTPGSVDPCTPRNQVETQQEKDNPQSAAQVAH